MSRPLGGGWGWVGGWPPWKVASRHSRPVPLFSPFPGSFHAGPAAAAAAQQLQGPGLLLQHRCATCWELPGSCALTQPGATHRPLHARRPLASAAAMRSWLHTLLVPCPTLRCRAVGRAGPAGKTGRRRVWGAGGRAAGRPAAPAAGGMPHGVCLAARPTGEVPSCIDLALSCLSLP